MDQACCPGIQQAAWGTRSVVSDAQGLTSATASLKPASPASPAREAWGSAPIGHPAPALLVCLLLSLLFHLRARHHVGLAWPLLEQPLAAKQPTVPSQFDGCRTFARLSFLLSTAWKGSAEATSEYGQQSALAGARAAAESEQTWHGSSRHMAPRTHLTAVPLWPCWGRHHAAAASGTLHHLRPPLPPSSSQSLCGDHCLISPWCWDVLETRQGNTRRKGRGWSAVSRGRGSLPSLGPTHP